MLKDIIKKDMIAAMKARATDQLGTIRMLTAAIKQKEIDEQITLDDDSVLAVIQKMVKQRRDAAKQYKDAGRTELASKELAEIDVLEAYLPAQLDETAIISAVKAMITETNASGMQDMGKVMGALKAKLTGQADMSLVSKHVKALLG